MIEHPKLPKKDRKDRIKAQNQKRRRPRIASYDAKTPEEFNRHMEGFMMIVFGILKIANIDPEKMVKEARAKADEFPAEL